MSTKSNAKAFTMIELMVAMAIMALLAAMVLPVLTIAGASNDKSSTRSLIGIVGSSIDVFKIEYGLPPIPKGKRGDPIGASWYPNDTDGSWENQQLWWRLTTPMSMGDKLAMYNAMDDKSLQVNEWQSFAHVDASFPYDPDAAKENQRIVDSVDAAKVESYKTEHYADRSHSKWTSSDPADTTPDASHNGFSARGWVAIYLIEIEEKRAVEKVQRSYFTYPALAEGDIDESYIQDDTIVDAWGNPLMYICEVESPVGARMVPNRGQQEQYDGIEPVAYDGYQRADMLDRNNDNIVDQEDWLTEPAEAEQLINWNGDSDVNILDWGDMRYYCRPGNGKGYLLSSPGEDEMCDTIWGREVNSDNINNVMSE